MRRPLPRFCLCVALSGLPGILAGCGAPEADLPPRTAGLEVREASATLLPDTGAVYLTVANPGPRGDRLLRVETGAAKAAETHESVDDGGVLRMVARPEGFEVPAGGTLELRPGGKHIMLIAPQAAANAAGKIPLTLHFEHAGAVEVQAEISAGTGDGGVDHGEHGHHGDHEHMDHGEMDHAEPAPDAGKS